MPTASEPGPEASGENTKTETVDEGKELRAHEFRFGKIATPFIRTVLQVIRNNDGLWRKVEPSVGQQKQLESRTALPGETHRVGSALFSNIYRNEQTAALYDLALFDTAQAESAFLKDQIAKGTNYAPLTVVGAGGVYGTIFSAAALKENPDCPPFGFDAGKRRGGIWSISGDVTLDKPWWRMNSRNRPEDVNKKPIPGTDGNLNTLGAEVQNLQVPDISSAQYPTNNELGRVLSHDNTLSNQIVVNAELVKVRSNQGQDQGQPGAFQQEYQDKTTGQRFFAYTDTIAQTTGLGSEDLGFDEKFSSTSEALTESRRQLKEGLVTPKVLTFFDLVALTTSNRRGTARDFRRFGLVGIGDTSKVIREHFIGIGGIDPGLPAQAGFVEEITVFGLNPKSREELARSERIRYLGGLLEVERENGGFFRIKPVEGRVQALGLPNDRDDLAVYIKRTDNTPDGEVVTYAPEFIPRLVTAAGFIDESERIYSGLVCTSLTDENAIREQINNLPAGSTIFYKPNSEIAVLNKISRIDIDKLRNGRYVEVTIVDFDGNTTRARIDKKNPLPKDKILLAPSQVAKIEVTDKHVEFQPVIDPDFDPEIPIGQKAVGFEIYRLGACTNLPITEKEKGQSPAYEKVPENTKSIFRFEEGVKFAGRKLARQTPRVAGALNLAQFRPKPIELPDIETVTSTRDSLTFSASPKAAIQELSANLNTNDLLAYLAASRLNCVFPKGFDNLSFIIKRTPSTRPDVPFNFTIAFSQPLPKTGGWEQVDSFIQEELTQRLLVTLTEKRSATAEISIGIKRGVVNPREVTSKSVKLGSG